MTGRVVPTVDDVDSLRHTLCVCAETCWALCHLHHHPSTTSSGRGSPGQRKQQQQQQQQNRQNSHSLAQNSQGRMGKAHVLCFGAMRRAAISSPLPSGLCEWSNKREAVEGDHPPHLQAPSVTQQRQHHGSSWRASAQKGDCHGPLFHSPSLVLLCVRHSPPLCVVSVSFITPRHPPRACILPPATDSSVPLPHVHVYVFTCVLPPTETGECRVCPVLAVVQQKGLLLWLHHAPDLRPACGHPDDGVDSRRGHSTGRRHHILCQGLLCACGGTLWWPQCHPHAVLPGLSFSARDIYDSPPTADHTAC